MLQDVIAGRITGMISWRTPCCG